MLICSKCKFESEEVGEYTLYPSCRIGFMMNEQELLKVEMEKMEFEDETQFEQFLQNKNFEGAENFEEEQTSELSF